MINVMSTNYIFQSPYFYKVTDKGYRKLELYLPCGENTYQEPIETTKQRWLSDLNETDGYIKRRTPLAGKMVMKVKLAFDNKDYYGFVDDVFTNVTKLAKHQL